MDKIRKFGKLLSILRVEPAAMLCIAGIVLTFMRTENILLRRVCEVDFQRNKTLCDDFINQNGDFEDLEVEVQKEMVNIKSFSTVFVITNVASILVFGPLSDKWGRKFAMILSCVGNIIQPLSIILLLEYTEVKAIVISVVNQGLMSLGGSHVLFGMVANSHIVDITGIEERSMRLGVLQAFYSLGTPAASLLGAVLSDYDVGDYETLFIAMGVHTACLLVVVFVVKERNPGKDETETKSDKSCVQTGKNFVHTIFKKREGDDRLKLGLLMIAYLFVIAPFNGEFQLLYLFLRKRLSWDLSQYSYFNITVTCIRAAGTAISLWVLSKKLNLSDPLVGIISGVSQICACIAYAFSYATWAMYASSIVDFLNETFAVIPRSIMSKIVSREEAGTIFTVMAVINVSLPSAFVPLYTYVYNKSIEVDFEGGFNLLSLGLSIPPVLIFIWLYSKHRSNTAHKNTKSISNRISMKDCFIFQPDVNYFGTGTHSIHG